MSSKISYADVVELVDTLALGASAARREGSSPFIRTKDRADPSGRFCLWYDQYDLDQTHGVKVRIAGGNPQGNVTDELCSSD